MRADDGAGSAARKSVEVAARSGDPHAKALLRGPERPTHVGHYVDWVYQVHGRSGVDSVSGRILPVSYQTIWSWRDLYGHILDECDISVIAILDGVMLDPESAAKVGDDSN